MTIPSLLKEYPPIFISKLKPSHMKRVYKIAAFAVLTVLTIITLTSGIRKNDGGFKDLVEELYDQAVKQNDNLRSIEDEIEKFYKKKQDALEKYYAYNNYHTRYYQDARSNTGAISNVATKQRASELIAKSEARYNTKIADWKAIITALDASEKELNDLHSLLKIMISEAIIDKAQNSGLPDNGKAKEVNSDLQKVIEKIKAITK
jgi:hypothetical protein